MNAAPARPRRHTAVVLWGAIGVVLVLIEAIYRLGTVAARLIGERGLSSLEVALLAVWTIAIGYFEGYRGFQQRFSPRVVARALHLGAHPRPLHVALAPFFCMALFHATRRRLTATWGLVVGIVALILLVRRAPPVYRAIVDAGVACALAWGTIALLLYLARGLAGSPMPVDPDLPDEAARDQAPDGAVSTSARAR